jgi:hypothetical protein
VQRRALHRIAPSAKEIAMQRARIVAGSVLSLALPLFAGAAFGSPVAPPGPAAAWLTGPAQPASYQLIDASTIAGRPLQLRVVPDGLRSDRSGGGLEVFQTLRTTYRATWYQGLNWTTQVGLTTRLDDPQRHGSSDRTFSGASAPRLHLAAGGHVFERFNWAVETDSLLRRRGSAFDLGLQVNYSLSRGLDFYGGYKWADGAAEDDYSAPPAARSGPNVGVRYRF